MPHTHCHVDGGPQWKTKGNCKLKLLKKSRVVAVELPCGQRREPILEVSRHKAGSAPLAVTAGLTSRVRRRLSHGGHCVGTVTRVGEGGGAWGRSDAASEGGTGFNHFGNLLPGTIFSSASYTKPVPRTTGYVRQRKHACAPGDACKGVRRSTIRRGPKMVNNLRG